MTLSPVTVTKRWVTASGQPETGSVRFYPAASLTDVQNDTDATTSPVTADLDDAGGISVSLYPGRYRVLLNFADHNSFVVDITEDGELPLPVTGSPAITVGDPPFISGGTP